MKSSLNKYMYIQEILAKDFILSHLSFFLYGLKKKQFFLFRAQHLC